MKGTTAFHWIACRKRQMPNPCVTSPQRTISSAFWLGVMRCSQIPETTSPIAKPDNPVVMPPRNAASRKSPKERESMVELAVEATRDRDDASWFQGHRYARLTTRRWGQKA